MSNMATAITMASLRIPVSECCSSLLREAAVRPCVRELEQNSNTALGRVSQATGALQRSRVI